MQVITVNELKTRLDAGEHVHIVDVREPYENAEFNIGGLLIPLGKIQTLQIDELDELKTEEIIVYCRSGNRSGQACQILQMAGFTNVKNLTGGMLDWREQFKV